MDIQAVRVGLATAAKAVIPRAFDYVPDTVSPPAFFVGEGRPKYHQTFGGLVESEFTCYAVTSAATDRSGQAAAIGYLQSLPPVLEADQTLGGVCDTCTVYSAAGPRQLTFGPTETRYWGVEFTVTVRG